MSTITDKLWGIYLEMSRHILEWVEADTDRTVIKITPNSVKLMRLLTSVKVNDLRLSLKSSQDQNYLKSLHFNF